VCTAARADSWSYSFTSVVEGVELHPPAEAAHLDHADLLDPRLLRAGAAAAHLDHADLLDPRLLRAGAVEHLPLYPAVPAELEEPRRMSGHLR